MPKEIPSHYFFDKGKEKEERPIVRPGETKKDIPASEETKKSEPETSSKTEQLAKTKFRPHELVHLRKEDGTLELGWEIINILKEQGREVARIRKEELDKKGQKIISQKKVSLEELAE